MLLYPLITCNTVKIGMNTSTDSEHCGKSVILGFYIVVDMKKYTYASEFGKKRLKRKQTEEKKIPAHRKSFRKLLIKESALIVRKYELINLS